MNRRFKFGEDFDITDVEVKEGIKVRDDNSRSLLVMTLISIGVIFLLGAAAMGFREGAFDKLEAVWLVVAAPFGAVMQHYFGPTK